MSQNKKAKKLENKKYKKIDQRENLNMCAEHKEQ